MSDTVVKNVHTKTVGFGPILKHYFQRFGIQRIVDEHVKLDPHRKVLT